jgi:adenosylcobinamide-GDP ribazoletransferase
MRIMRDHRVGSFGVIGLILILGIKYLALDSLPKQTAMKGLLVALALSRYSMVQLLRRAPYARKEGGLGLAFKETLTNKEWLAAGILSLTFSLLFFKMPGLALWGLVVFSTFLLEKFFVRKMGGVTGDVLGATNEINETLVLVGIAGLNQGG